MWSTQRIGAAALWAGLAVFLIGADLVGNPNCPPMPWTDCGMSAVSWGPPVMWAGLALAVVGGFVAAARAGIFALGAALVLALGAGLFAWGTTRALTPDCSLAGSCYAYPDAGGIIARSAGILVVIEATVVVVLASRATSALPLARAGWLAGLLALAGATAYAVGGTPFDYACGPHYVPGSVAGATTLGCLQNPWSGVAIGVAAALGALALATLFLGWRAGRAAAARSVKEPVPAASTPPAPRS